MRNAYTVKPHSTLQIHVIVTFRMRLNSDNTPKCKYSMLIFVVRSYPTYSLLSKKTTSVTVGSVFTARNRVESVIISVDVI